MSVNRSDTLEDPARLRNDLRADPVTGQEGQLGVQGLASSYAAIASRCCCRKPS
jgi:hypothetical protein